MLLNEKRLTAKVEELSGKQGNIKIFDNKVLLRMLLRDGAVLRSSFPSASSQAPLSCDASTRAPISAATRSI